MRSITEHINPYFSFGKLVPSPSSGSICRVTVGQWYIYVCQVNLMLHPYWCTGWQEAEMLECMCKVKKWVRSWKVSDKIAFIQNQLGSEYFESDHTHKRLVSKRSFFNTESVHITAILQICQTICKRTVEALKDNIHHNPLSCFRNMVK
jgi:hypothetical protein